MIKLHVDESFIIVVQRSIPLPANSGEAGAIDIFRDSRKHFRVHSQIIDCLKFSLFDAIHLSSPSLAHLLSLLPALRIINSTCGIVTSLPTVSDRWIIAELSRHVQSEGFHAGSITGSSLITTIPVAQSWHLYYPIYYGNIITINSTNLNIKPNMHHKSQLRDQSWAWALACAQ